tara:strand:- start:3756 stop:3971 length:216 start_codon:yes stop_codon:yes gene_type:complete
MDLISGFCGDKKIFSKQKLTKLVSEHDSFGNNCYSPSEYPAFIDLRSYKRQNNRALKRGFIRLGSIFDSTA